MGKRQAGQQARVISTGGHYDLVLDGPGGGINFGGLIMRYLMTVNGGGRAPDEQMYADMGRFVEELARAGVLLATGGLDRGTHVTASGGNITLTDGPFTESKEVIVSFALIEARSKGRGGGTGQAVLEDSRRRRGRHPPGVRPGGLMAIGA